VKKHSVSIVQNGARFIRALVFPRFSFTREFYFQPEEKNVRKISMGKNKDPVAA